MDSFLRSATTLQVFYNPPQSSLSELLQRVAIPVAVHLKIGIDLLTAISFLHREGISQTILHPDFINVSFVTNFLVKS